MEWRKENKVMEYRKKFVYGLALIVGAILSAPGMAQETGHPLASRSEYPTYLRAQNVDVLGVSVNGIISEIFMRPRILSRRGIC